MIDCWMWDLVRADEDFDVEAGRLRAFCGRDKRLKRVKVVNSAEGSCAEFKKLPKWVAQSAFQLAIAYKGTWLKTGRFMSINWAGAGARKQFVVMGPE